MLATARTLSVDMPDAFQPRFMRGSMVVLEQVGDGTEELLENTLDLVFHSLNFSALSRAILRCSDSIQSR
jgi:hypothetical protein